MKKITKIALSCLAFCVFALSFGFVKSNIKTENANAYIVGKEKFIDWDTENKLIYAYQNSIIIARDGAGTTIYLDLPQGYIAGTQPATGDGLITAEDMSLAELYEADQTAHSTPAPADGANLSDWSIVFGGKDVSASPDSSTKMTVTMTGGDIKTIYAGHSSSEFSITNTMKGTVEFTMTGGSVDRICTDNGYDEFVQSGSTSGATYITFNLFGGMVRTLDRTERNIQGAHNSRINLKGDIQITDGIKFETEHYGEKIYVVGALSNPSILNFDLNNKFSRSGILFNLDSAAVSSVNLSAISLSNAPEGSGDWEVYKSLSNSVHFGYNSKILSATIQGDLTVGKTLTVAINPAKATYESIEWFRRDAFMGNATKVGYGETYTLKDEDGGKIIYAVIVDKNNPGEPIIAETSTVIKRITTPQVITENGKTIVYANGNDLIISADGNGTTIYLDAGVIGTLDSTDISLKAAGVEDAFENGSDLSNVIVSAGCANGKNAGDIAITLISGNVGEIIVKSIINEEPLMSNIVINLYGGSVGKVSANKFNVAVETIINIHGDVKATLYGIQHENGPRQINVVSNITSADGSVVVVIDKTQLTSDQAVAFGLSSDYLNIAKFKFIDDNGAELNTFSKNIKDSSIMLYPIAVEEVKIAGTLRVDRKITAKYGPNNANVTFKWFRSSTNSFEDAVEISGATGETYKLTKDDLGKFIFAVANHGSENQVVAVSKAAVKKAFPIWLIVMICVVSSLLAIVIVFAIWFVLWKKGKAKAWFMQKPFEWIGNGFSKRPKSQKQNKEIKKTKTK